MRIAIILAGRNVRVFLRDKTAVLFTFLSVFIIVSLYALFLGDSMVGRLAEHIGDIRIAQAFTDTWVMAGVLVVSSVTVTLGALEIVISDKNNGSTKDFLVAPIRRWQIVMAYLMSSWAVGLIMGLLVLALSQFYIAVRGGDLISLRGLLGVIGLMVVNVLSFSASNYLLVSFLSSNAAFSTFSTIIGTMVGFVTGVYVPLGILPGFVQNIIQLIPATHSAAIMRRLFMAAPLKGMYENVSVEIAEEFTSVYGIVLHRGGSTIGGWASISYIAAVGAVFFGASVLRMLRKRA